MVRLFHVASLSALLVTRILQGDIGGVPGLTPEQQGVHDAASIKDPNERERSLERAISAGLLALDVKAQEVVHPGIRGKLVVRNISRSHGGTRDERS